jgi:hypothetical protein
MQLNAVLPPHKTRTDVARKLERLDARAAQVRDLLERIGVI